MNKITFAGLVTGALLVGTMGLAAIEFSAPALADNGGTVALPGPVPVYPQNTVLGGANPYVPFGTNPSVPYGVWNQN